MQVELVSSQNWQRRGPHKGPNSNYYEHQKQHPLHRKTQKKSPLVGELIRPSPHGEDGEVELITESVSPHFKRWKGVTGDSITQPNLGRRERLLSRRYLFRRVIEDILLKLLNCAEGFMRRPSMNIHQLLNQGIRGLSDRGANGIDNLVAPRECRQP